MSDGSATTQNRWFGHPRGLSTLFFTEMWERFSFYGMRAILMLFMTAAVVDGGLGWGTGRAAPIYGLYLAMVYMTSLPGGWIADRVIGQRRAVFVGGVIITLGHISLMFHSVSTFYLGLFLVVIGTGLLKPNISTMVGELYSKDDARRDAGFSVFYMGINVGAFLSPLVCGYLAQSAQFKGILRGWGLTPEGSWHWGFGAAAVGMALGLVQYVASGARLGDVGIEPLGKGDAATFGRNRRILWTGTAATVAVAFLVIFMNPGSETVAASVPADVDTEPTLVKWLGYLIVAIPILYFTYLHAQRGWDAAERKRLIAIPVFFFAASLFWSAFEQAGSSLTLFADQFTHNTLFGRAFPSSWWQSVNAALIVLLAPLFAMLWIRLGKREPSSPSKFASGLFFVGVGFLVLAFGAMFSGPEGDRVSPGWLFTVYLLHTIGELCLSPVGLSTMTKLAPARVTGQMMGVWFMATAMGAFIGGKIAALFDKFPLPQLFGAIFGTSLLAAIVMLVIAKPVRRLMGGVK